MTSSDLHQTSSNLVQKCVLARTQPTAPESRMLTFPCLCGAVPQSSLRCCLLGYSPHFTANKLNSHCALFLFFLIDKTLAEWTGICSKAVRGCEGVCLCVCSCVFEKERGRSELGWGHLSEKPDCCLHK